VDASCNAEFTFGRSRVWPTVAVAEPEDFDDEKDPPPPCACLLGGDETATRSEAALVLRSCEVVRRCIGEGYPELVVGAAADGDEEESMMRVSCESVTATRQSASPLRISCKSEVAGS
jgi:hypothetical protein